MKALSVGIGILAYNEQALIADTLKSLFLQSIFTNPRVGKESAISKVEVFVVPNGCSDDTAGVARAALDHHLGEFTQHESNGCELACRVHEIETPGKSNAWNLYVHELSDKSLDLFVMVDADIEFNEIDTIKNSLAALVENDNARVAVDLPLKSIFKKPDKTLIDRISLRVSRDHLDHRVAVAGSFYCVWAETLRQVWMPVGLPTEDSFVKTMILTDMFRKPMDNSKIVRAENASHFYVPESSLKGIWRHELRGMIGTSINCFLTWDFLLFATDPKGPGAGVVLRNLIEENPDWLQLFLQNTIRNKGFWVLPRGSVFGVFKSLRGKHPVRNLRSYLIVLLRFCINLPIAIIANHKIKKGQGVGFW